MLRIQSTCVILIELVHQFHTRLIYEIIISALRSFLHSETLLDGF